MRAMKPHHAAGLALIGWYLMLPPHHVRNLRVTVSADAPLREWKILKPFDKAVDCDHELTQRIMDCGNCPLDSLWLSAQCVATDDPRLEEN
jgi:hypothetical protein